MTGGRSQRTPGAVRATLLMLAGLGLFAVLDANSKNLSGTYPVEQVVLIRHLVLLTLLLTARAVWPGAGGPIATAYPARTLARAAGMLGAAVFFFLAFRSLPLADGYLVFFTAPFMTLGLAVVVLREKMRAAAWGWAAVGFGGVVIAMLPDLRAGGLWLSYLYAFIGTICHAVVMTSNRGLRHEGGFARLVVWPAVLAVSVLLPFAIADWRPAPTKDLLALMANGVLAGVANICLALAFRHATAARLAPLEYSALVWAVLFDVLIWHHWPGVWTLVGAVVIVLACWMSQRKVRKAP
ncbi:DMT family transporter [Humitalea sp. 24SJ18S-53]|uniref:DMT family transporter n=1 Tax=Humitalea sp. 24SJ18S-53 TaxID=3422307 RepID=UPI003D668BDB